MFATNGFQIWVLHRKMHRLKDFFKYIYDLKRNCTQVNTSDKPIAYSSYYIQSSDIGMCLN